MDAGGMWMYCKSVSAMLYQIIARVYTILYGSSTKMLVDNGVGVVYAEKVTL